MSAALPSPSNFEKNRDRFAQKIQDAFELQHEPQKKFLPTGAARNIFNANKNDLRKLLDSANYGLTAEHSYDADQFVDLVLEKTEPAACLMLATLLCIPGLTPTDWIRFQDEFIDRDEDRVPYEMPLDKETARRIFGRQLGAMFYTTQFEICPVVLHKNEKVTYVGHKEKCRVPYLEEKFLGRGAFGEVYKVRIPEGHLLSEKSQNLATTLARKDFRLRQSKEHFVQEWQVMKEILQARKEKPKNIMVTLASLEIGQSFSIFYPLAKCNLWEYLNNHGGVSASVLNAADKHTARRNIFSQAKGLAEALDFLHEFENNNEKLSCFHMDLKPTNILVSDSDVWQITDFGISRVEKWTKSGVADQPTVFKLDAMFISRNANPGQTAGSITGPQGGGTYLAPEAMSADGKVKRVCDVWSLGCVLSQVMTFAHGGPMEVENFQRHLSDQGKGSDWFFSTRPPKFWQHPSKHLKIKDTDRVLSCYVQNPRVKEWFKYLQKSVDSKDAPCWQKLYKKMLKILQHHILVPDPGDRMNAHNFSKEFQKYFDELPNLVSEVPMQSRPPQDYSPPGLQKASINRTLFSTQYEDNDIRRVAFCSPETIYLYNIVDSEGLDSPAPKTFSPSITKGSWSYCALNTDFICAAISSSSFKCEILDINRGASNDLVVCNDRYGPIIQCAITANSMYMAFVTRIPEGFQVLVFTNSDLQKRNGSWRNHVAEKSVVRGRKDDGILGLEFSRCGRFLHAVFKLRSEHEYGAKTLVWDIERGKRLMSHKLLDRQGNDDPFDFVTASRHHGDTPLPSLLTQGRYLYSFDPTDTSHASSTNLSQSHRVLDFVIDPEFGQAFFLATSSYKASLIRVFGGPFPISQAQKWEWTDLTPKDMPAVYDYNASKDSFCFFPMVYGGEAVRPPRLVIATTKGKLIVVWLPITQEGKLIG